MRKIFWPTTKVENNHLKFLRVESLNFKTHGRTEKDVVLIFLHGSFSCVYAQHTDAGFCLIKEKFLGETNLRRTEKRYFPDFFIMCHFDVLCAAHRHDFDK